MKIKNGNGNERKTEERGRRKRKVREGEVVAGVCTFKYILNHVVVRLLLFKEMTTRYCVLCVLHTHVSCFCWCRDVVSSFIFVQHPSTIFYILRLSSAGILLQRRPRQQTHHNAQQPCVSTVAGHDRCFMFESLSFSTTAPPHSKTIQSLLPQCLGSLMNSFIQNQRDQPRTTVPQLCPPRDRADRSEVCWTIQGIHSMPI